MLTDTQYSPKKDAIQGMTEFAFYLTTGIEKQLELCLKLLENTPVDAKKTSLSATALSTAISHVPFIGSDLSTAIKETELYIFEKIDEKKAYNLADLVYFFSDNKKLVRDLLIRSSVNIFSAFEQQFLQVTTTYGGRRRAMNKLAKDGVNRIFKFLLKGHHTKEFLQKNLEKGILVGPSLTNKVGVKHGKTVETKNGDKWHTANIFEDVGVYFEDRNEYYGSSKLKSNLYGYRRAFDWENYTEISETMDEEYPAKPPSWIYDRNHDFEPIYTIINEYIMTKNPEEDATLDRDMKHQELLKDGQEKHAEIMEMFLDKFQTLLDKTSLAYKEISNEKILGTIEKTTKLCVENQSDIQQKLEAIHETVVETKTYQDQLQSSTQEFKVHIDQIKEKQEELAEEVSKKSPMLGQLVEAEAQKLERGIRNNVKPKVQKELRRIKKKWF